MSNLNEVNTVLKELLRRPIAFHPLFVDLAGSLTAGIMLSQCYYWSRIVQEHQPDRRGWFYKSREEWKEETGLTRREQENARKLLREKPFWKEIRKGVPCTIWFCLDLDLLENAVQEAIHHNSQLARNRPTSWHESAQQVGTKAPNKLTRNRPTSWHESAQLYQRAPKEHFKKLPQPSPENPAPAEAENPELPDPDQLLSTEALPPEKMPDHDQTGDLPAEAIPPENMPEPFIDPRSFTDPRQTDVTKYFQKWIDHLKYTVNILSNDKYALKAFLKRNKTLTAFQIKKTMDHAFNSDLGIPLKPGFSLREFLTHYGKYERGPIMRGGPKIVSKEKPILASRPAPPGYKYIRDRKNPGVIRLVSEDYDDKAS